MFSTNGKNINIDFESTCKKTVLLYLSLCTILGIPFLWDNLIRRNKQCYRGRTTYISGTIDYFLLVSAEECYALENDVLFQYIYCVLLVDLSKNVFVFIITFIEIKRIFFSYNSQPLNKKIIFLFYRPTL